MATVDKEKSTEIEIHENIIPTEGTDANEEEEGEDVYEVEKILGVSFTKGQPLYKVRWSGYSPSWDTWEPPDNLSSCQDMIDKYLDDRKKTLALGTDNSGEGCSKAKSKRRRKSKSSQKKLSFDGSDYDDDRQSVSTNESTLSVNKQKKKPTYYYASSSDEEFDTLKDKFWRDLDEGKVNVFGSDMYSKVKEQGRVGKSSDGSSTGSNSPPSKHSDPDPHKSLESESVTSCKSDSHKRRKSTSEKNDRDDSSITSKRKSSSKSKSRSKRVKSTSDDAHGAKLDTGQKRERSREHSRERKSSSSSKGTSSSSKHKRPAFSVTTTTLYEVSYSDSGGDSSDAVSPPYYTPGHPGWRLHPLSTSSSDSPIRCAKPKLEGKSSDKKKRHSTSSSKDKNLTSSTAPFIAPSTSSTTTPSTEPLSEAMPPAQSSPTRSPSTQPSSTVIIPDVPSEKTTVVPLEKESISTADEPQSVQKSLDTDPEMQTSEACAEEPTVLSEPDHVTTEMVDDDDSVQDQDNESPVAPEVMDLSDNENPMGSKYLEHPVEHETPDSKFDLDIIERKDQIPSDVNAESLELSNDKAKTKLSEASVEIGKAVLANNYDRVRKALNTKKKYELEQPDKNGTTLAMVAAKYGYDDILELLVLNGANMNVRQKNGCTALMLACEQGLRCTVELLLLMGARVNPQIHGNKGESALIKAARRGHSDIVKVLLEYGANFAAQSTNNNTSLNYAKREDYQPVIDVLTSHIARVTSEFEQQVMLTLNNTATVQCALFPIHCFSLSDSDKFHITFNHELQPTQSGVGMLLFIAHAIMSPEEVKCRFYGPCAVMCVSLNTIEQHPLTDDGNFVMSFTPLNNGKNELEISTVKSPKSKAKLIVCAYKSQLVLPKE